MELIEKCENGVAFLRTMVCVCCSHYEHSEPRKCGVAGRSIVELVTTYKQSGSLVKCPIDKW